MIMDHQVLLRKYHGIAPNIVYYLQLAHLHVSIYA